MTVTVIGLERVIKEDMVIVIEVHWILGKNVIFQLVLNVLTIFFTRSGGKVVCSINNASINNFINIVCIAIYFPVFQILQLYFF